MEENSSFISVKKNKNGKYTKKIKSNKKTDWLNLILIILIIAIIILILIIGILLSKNNSIENVSVKDNINNFTNISVKINHKRNKSFLDDIFQGFGNYTNSKSRLFQTREDPITENKNQIHISMAIDNKFVYPSLVSMASCLSNNNNEKNIIIYHLLFSNDFKAENYEIFESLKKKFDFSLNYYIIPSLFNHYKRWMGGTHTVYYKILLPFIFHDLDRIIYLDADTLIFKDLYEMYNLPFNGNYALGYPFHDSYKIDKFVPNATYYINGGVILFNNKLIREDNKDIELFKFTKEKNRELWFLEQDSINIIFYGKIGILPLKYGIYMYGNIDSFEKSVQIRIRFKLNRTEVINAINNPSLVHFSGCNPKVWHKRSSNEFGVNEICQRFHDEFYNYAKKTDYYQQIFSHYGN